jgi:hypothetical protein
MLAPAVGRHVSLFARGGRAVLAAIRKQNYDTLTRRPAVSRWQKGRLMVSAMTAFAAAKLTGRRQ